MRRFLGLMALCLMALVTLPSCFVSDCTYRRPLEGKVVNMGSRMSSTADTIEQKVSLVVQATQSEPLIDQVANGPSGVAIECLSTRCASIVVGTCHRFLCVIDYRFTEPDVVVCKHDKEIFCSDPGDKPTGSRGFSGLDG